MTEAQDNGGYGNEGVLWHQHSNRLLIQILEYFNKKNAVLDIGCGHNWYANTMKYLGYVARGIDSQPMNGVDFIADITKDLSKEVIGISGIKQNVISLEVGEHIPSELSAYYLNNITMFGGDVVMSWAVPGQEGVGHINCQTNDWVVAEMEMRKYKLDSEKTNCLRGAVEHCHCNWFKNTVMYFTPCE